MFIAFVLIETSPTPTIRHTSGLIDYYTEFLSTIYTASPENYEVIGVGHEGHSPDHPLSTLEALSRPAVFNTRPLPTLQDQIDRKIAYVDEIRASYPSETKLVLIGHSVGGYICQEVRGVGSCR